MDEESKTGYKEEKCSQIVWQESSVAGSRMEIITANPSSKTSKLFNVNNTPDF